MRVPGYFELAQKSGQVLVENESTVSRAPESFNGKRVWFGEDSEGRAVAYFETDTTIESAFSVSQVITVESTESVDVQQDETLQVVKVTCHEPDLYGVFYVFLEDLLVKAESAENITQLIVTAASEWRSLLHIAGLNFPEATAAGLYGELLFLEEAVRTTGPVALHTWRGPSQDVHDFIAGARRVEVKTSSFQNRMAVTIHGLQQLQQPVDATLTLAVAEVQKHGGGDNLNLIVDRILELGVEREVFLQKLYDVGLVPGAIELDKHQFSLVSWRYWEITKESPVLSSSQVSEEVRKAISDVRFSLNLGALGEAKQEFDWDLYGL